MNIPHLVDYWKRTAAEDWQTVESLMEKERYPHALFFAHLYIEKLLKALYVHRKQTHAPYGHKLETLAEKSGLEMSPQLQRFFVEISTLNIETRYPEDRPQLYEKFTRDYTAAMVKQIHKVGEWLESLLQ